MFHHVTVGDAVLSGGYAYARTTVYARKPSLSSNMSATRFLDVRFLRRLFTAVNVAFATDRFIRLSGGPEYCSARRR